MEYVVFRSSGKQYKGKVGDTIIIDRIAGDSSSSLLFSEVLLWVSNGESKIGKPTIPGAKIRAKILEHIKGDKIRVSKYKAKVRYRKVIGFRPYLTKLQIEKIEIDKTSAGKTVPSVVKSAIKK